MSNDDTDDAYYGVVCELIRCNKMWWLVMGKHLATAGLVDVANRTGETQS